MHFRSLALIVFQLSLSNTQKKFRPLFRTIAMSKLWDPAEKAFAHFFMCFFTELAFMLHIIILK
jgi:hypothetical protein